jgi:TetR/AcrR family transcriptional regulator, copper-responsive repressor
MKMTENPGPAVRGRPRAFDRERALQRATDVFWRKGYEAASLSDLTSAMGINPPSLYAAFGDKETLYLEALEYYVNGAACRKALFDDAPTAREAVEALLLRSATALPEIGLGCMLVTSAVNASSPKVRKTLTAYRAGVEAGLRKRIERGIREGELPAGTGAAGLAKFYETVTQGMSTQVADGASPKVLRGIVATAMRAWPEKKPTRRKAG